MIREIVIGGKSNRNRFEPSTSIKEIDAFGKLMPESYSSIYSFGEEIKEHIKVAGGIKGYRGPASTECLFWDIDASDNLSAALSSTRELYGRLLNYFEKSNIKVFYSGSKGMHIYAFSSDIQQMGMNVKIPIITRLVCLKIADGIQNVDTTVYNTTRIFRIPNSQHGGTGRFKVDITDDIDFIDDNGIVSYSSEPRRVDWSSITSSNNDNIKTLIREALADYENKRYDMASSDSKIDYHEVFNSLRNGLDSGKRNDTLARIAAMLHHKGHDTMFVSEFLLMVNRQSKDPLDEQEVFSIINSMTSYPVNNPENEVATADNISTFGAAGRSFIEIVKTSLSNGGGFGEMFQHLNDPMGMVIPGDVIAIVANSGVGKSSLGMLLSRESVKVAGEYALFASLEMSKEGMFFRATSMKLVSEDGYMPPKDIANSVVSNESLIEELNSEWERVLILDNVSSIEQIEQHYLILKERLKEEGKALSTLVIDYGQMLDNTDTNDKEKKVSRGLKAMAKRLRTKLYLLLQLNKLFVNPYEEPTRTHIEGSGGWYQSMDYCLMFWKSKAYDGIIHGKLDKNRWGKPDTRFDIEQKGLSFRTIDEVPEPATEEEHMQESQYRKRRKD